MRQLRLLPSRPRHTSLPLKSTSRAYAPVSRPPTPWGLPTTSRPTSSPRSRLSSRSPSRWVSATAGARCAGRARSDRPGDHLPERSQNDGRVTVARLRRWHPRARRGRSAASASCHNDSRVSCASQEGHVPSPGPDPPRGGLGPLAPGPAPHQPQGAARVPGVYGGRIQGQWRSLDYHGRY